MTMRAYKQNFSHQVPEPLIKIATIAIRLFIYKFVINYNLYIKYSQYVIKVI